jgi:hypothetical protein
MFQPNLQVKFHASKPRRQINKRVNEVMLFRGTVD